MHKAEVSEQMYVGIGTGSIIISSLLVILNSAQFKTFPTQWVHCMNLMLPLYNVPPTKGKREWGEVISCCLFSIPYNWRNFAKTLTNPLFHHFCFLLILLLHFVLLPHPPSSQVQPPILIFISFAFTPSLLSLVLLPSFSPFLFPRPFSTLPHTPRPAFSSPYNLFSNGSFVWKKKTMRLMMMRLWKWIWGILWVEHGGMRAQEKRKKHYNLPPMSFC